nr:lysophosphatidylcholine acyltransferase 1-like [Neomonachus schauinslandi]
MKTIWKDRASSPPCGNGKWTVELARILEPCSPTPKPLSRRAQHPRPALLSLPSPNPTQDAFAMQGASSGEITVLELTQPMYSTRRTHSVSNAKTSVTILLRENRVLVAAVKQEKATGHEGTDLPPRQGPLIKYIRPVFVSRSDQDSRRKTVEEIRRRAQSNGKWPQIMIFPEGTCTNRTCLITFKPGAFIPGVPVQPVALRYPNKLDTITWTWQGPGALKILWLTLCQFHNRVEIEFLPVYSPSEEEKKDPALYASNVRRVMAEALGISVTDYTFEDCQLALAEGQLRLPADTCLLEFARLVRGLGLKPETLEKDLDKYSKSAKMQKGGNLGLPEFAEYLGVPVSDTLEDMFSLFDESGEGRMDPREYVVALSVVCRPSRTLDTIQLAFKMYGSQDGDIDEDALSSILKTALGVAELSVTNLFRAIDQEGTGRITFGEWPVSVTKFLEGTLHPRTGPQGRWEMHRLRAARAP